MLCALMFDLFFFVCLVIVCHDAQKATCLCREKQHIITVMLHFSYGGMWLCEVLNDEQGNNRMGPYRGPCLVSKVEPRAAVRVQPMMVR